MISTLIYNNRNTFSFVFWSAIITQAFVYKLFSVLTDLFQLNDFLPADANTIVQKAKKMLQNWLVNQSKYVPKLRNVHALCGVNRAGKKNIIFSEENDK